MRPHHLLLLFAAFVSANTEIINIAATQHLAVHRLPQSTKDWPLISPLSQEKRWDVSSDDICTDIINCSHDLWLRFNLDDPQWMGFSKFTFRISWPATFPLDFHIKTYTPSELAKFLQLDTNSSSTNDPDERTRNIFARIRIVDTGVLTPTASLSNRSVKRQQVISFNTILEPLYLGILPQTLLPTMSLLVPLILISGFIVFPKVSGYLDTVVRDVRKEIHLKDE